MGLEKKGPETFFRKKKGDYTFAIIVLSIKLNIVIRPQPRFHRFMHAGTFAHLGVARVTV